DSAPAFTALFGGFLATLSKFVHLLAAFVDHGIDLLTRFTAALSYVFLFILRAGHQAFTKFLARLRGKQDSEQRTQAKARDKPSNSCCFLFWHLLISFAHGRNYAIIWIVANAYWPGNAHLGSPYDAKAQALSAAKQRLLFGFGCLNEAISKLRIRLQECGGTLFRGRKSSPDFHAGKTIVGKRAQLYCKPGLL